MKDKFHVEHQHKTRFDMYYRCPKCKQMSNGKKCKSCKISVANASYCAILCAQALLKVGLIYDY